MKELIIYQLEVAICILALSVLYYLLWKKETNFQMKRVFLCSIPILAFLIPWFDLSIVLAMDKPSQAIQYLNYLPSQYIVPVISSVAADPVSESLSIWQILFLVWISGVIFMAIRLLVSYYSIWQIYRNSKNLKGRNYRLVDEPIQSFSFFNLVVINRHHADSNAFNHILAHELAHSQQMHSLDVILFESLKIIQWFNPLLWLLTNESRQNLEYLADQEATAVTKNVQGYQFAIVQHATNTRYQLLTSEFSKSNLKHRINMMDRPNNQKIHGTKLLLLVPVLAILFMSFSVKLKNLDIKKEIAELLPVFSLPETGFSPTLQFPSIQKIDITSYFRNSQNNVISSHEEVFAIVEDLPYPSTGSMDSFYEMIYENLEYPVHSKEKGIEGKVIVQFIVLKDGTLSELNVLEGIGTACDAEAVRVIKEGPDWIPGEHAGEKVNVRMIVPVTFSLHDNAKKISGIVLSELGAPVIGCMIKVKGTQISTLSDGDGRFIIEVEPGSSVLVFDYAGLKSRLVEVSNEENLSIILMDDEKSDVIPVPLMWGQVTAPSIPPPNLNDSSSLRIGFAISSDDAEKPSLNDQDHEKETFDIVFADDEKAPLFIVDGVEISRADFSLIHPGDIAHITVLTDKSNVAKYGEKAENGVLLIDTKKGTNIKSDQTKVPDATDTIIVEDNNEERIIIRGSNINIDNENPPLIYKDGKEISMDDIKEIDPRSMKSIDVLKGDSAIEKYGMKGKNGVILITTKE